MARLSEDYPEQQCLEWFQVIGYTHVFAPQLDRDTMSPERTDLRQVSLMGRLSSAPERLNPEVQANTLASAVPQLAYPNVPGLLACNRQFQGRKACQATNLP